MRPITSAPQTLAGSIDSILGAVRERTPPTEDMPISLALPLGFQIRQELPVLGIYLDVTVTAAFGTLSEMNPSGRPPLSLQFSTSWRAAAFLPSSTNSPVFR